MSDTPRTDAVADEPPGDLNVISIYTLARQLERELRESQAEKAVLLKAMDDCVAACLNWPSVKEAGRAGRELLEELNNLRAWKASAIAVECGWDAQAVGRLLDMTLGTEIKPQIQPKIEALLAEVEEMKETIRLQHSLMVTAEKRGAEKCDQELSLLRLKVAAAEGMVERLKHWAHANNAKADLDALSKWQEANNTAVVDEKAATTRTIVIGYTAKSNGRHNLGPQQEANK